MAAASPNATDAAADQCGAKTRGGGRCKLTAGKGTDHVGFGRCKLHSGNSPNGKIAAARLQAAAWQAEFAELEPDIQPHDALLKMVRLSYGLVSFYGRKYRELLHAQGEEALPVQHVETTVGGDDGLLTKTTSTVDLHIWGRLYHEAIDRAARISKTACDAGVEERRVRLAEQWADELADAFRRFIDEIGLNDDQMRRAPAVLESTLRRFEVIEGGRAA